MDKEASNGPWTRVEVLVGTPGSHIHTPVVEVKLNVTSCMGQVKTYIAALRERERGRSTLLGVYNPHSSSTIISFQI